MSGFSKAQTRLALILLLALVVRLYKINNPIGEWHAFRQGDTASVTREYVKHGIDLLHPHYLDLANIQSGFDNLEGYRMVEFPIINGIIAFSIRTFPFLPLELTSRVASLLASLVAIWSLYQLIKSLSGEKTAELTALMMSILPYSVFYSRAILPEPFLLAAFLTSLWLFERWLRHEKLFDYLGSLVLVAVALLLKPFVLFFVPVWLVLSWQKWQWQMLLQWKLYLYAGLAVLPLWWWRTWIEQFPSGIPVNKWLFNSNGIRWRPAWFRWLGWERLTKLMLGYLGILFLPLSFLHWKKDTWVYGTWWLSVGVYFSVIATGNVQHDYYQVIIIPIVCISLAKGILTASKLLNTKLPARISKLFLTFVVCMFLLMAWKNVAGYYQINHWEYVKAGQAVDRLVPPDAKVIAPAFGDTQFLFQTNRTGWPIGFEIEKKRAMGATHYVTTSYDDEARMLEEQYPTIEKTTEYLLLDLRQPLSTESAQESK